MVEKNVFVSHFGKDEENIGKLKNLLGSKGYTLKNSSIDSTRPNQANNPEYIKELLRSRIRWAGKMIVLVGPKTSTREWVNWEIEQANKQGIPVVGVYIHGASDSDIPENLEKYGDAIVGWNSDKIIGALEGKVTNLEKPDGSPYTTRYTPTREIC